MYYCTPCLILRLFDTFNFGCDLKGTLTALVNYDR